MMMISLPATSLDRRSTLSVTALLDVHLAGCWLIINSPGTVTWRYREHH
jgi:hypothetical protein